MNGVLLNIGNLIIVMFVILLFVFRVDFHVLCLCLINVGKQAVQIIVIR